MNPRTVILLYLAPSVVVLMLGALAALIAHVQHRRALMRDPLERQFRSRCAPDVELDRNGR